MSDQPWLTEQKNIATQMVSIGNRILADLEKINKGGSIKLTCEQKRERLDAARELNDLNIAFRKRFGIGNGIDWRKVQ